MKKQLVLGTSLLLPTFAQAATNYGDVTTGTIINNFEISDTIGTMNGGSIGLATGGDINTFTGDGVITQMNGGTIATMSGGTINRIGEEIDRDNARINQMSGGTIKVINHGYLDNMTGGTLETINNGTFGTVTGGHINFISNGNFVEIGSDAKIDTIANGLYRLVSNGDIGQIRHGRFENITGGKIDFISYALVDLLNGSTINEMENGEITRMSGGNIALKSGGVIVDMDGGVIGNMSGGSIQNALAGAQIDKLSSRGDVEHLNGGTITDIAGGLVEIMDSGTVSVLSGGFIDMVNGGTVVNSTGGTINALNGGTVSTLSGTEIISMYKGTVSSMTGGRIFDMYGETVENMTGGLIENMFNGTVAKLDGGSVSSFYSGIVQNMQSGTITDMYDGTVQTMDGGTIKKMAGGEVQSMNTGSINLMEGGKIKDMGATAVIANVNNGTIYGNVQSGAAITVGEYGNLYLDGGGNEFDGNVTANGAINAISYTFGSNSKLTLNNNGVLFIGGDNLKFNQISVNGGGAIAFESNVPFYNTIIEDLSSNGTGNLIFNINEADGSANILTVNNSAGGNFFVYAASHAQDDDDNVDKIKLLQDNSRNLSLSLPGGSYVGIGAVNYNLLDESGIWSLVIAPDAGLSDPAKIVGAAASSKLIQIYSIQNALHRRLGDLRLANQGNAPGLWLRTYTNQTKFKDLTTVENHNYGTEFGVDFVAAKNRIGRLILGGSLGYTYDDASYKTLYSQPGKSAANIPYGALYGTYLFKNNVYIDLVARYAYSDMRVDYFDGAATKQHFDTDSHIGMFTGEIGYLHHFTKKFSIEPRAELAYTYISGENFSDSLRYDVQYGREQSVLASVGTAFKYDFKYISSYLKLSYLNELEGKAKIRYDDAKYESNLSGSRFEVGTGFTSRIGKNSGSYLELTYQAGEKSYRNYIANIGLKYNF